MAKLMGLTRQNPVPFLDKPKLMLLAKMSWGLFYGLGFGAGLGYAYHTLQLKKALVVNAGPSAPE